MILILILAIALPFGWLVGSALSSQFGLLGVLASIPAGFFIGWGVTSIITSVVLANE